MGEEEYQGIQDPSQMGTSGLRFRSLNPMAERMWAANELHDSIIKENEHGMTHIGIEENAQLDSFRNALHKDDFIPGQDLSYLAGGQFGNSIYDEDITSVSQLNDIESFRSNQQSAGMKLLNGIGKMGVTTLTTALDSTIGLVFGTAEMLGRAFDEDKTWAEAFAGLYDNDFSRAMEKIEKSAEEWMPNYRTRQEREAAWYENLGTANFWADTVIKNAGFTIGTMLGTAAVGALTGGYGAGAGIGKLFERFGGSKLFQFLGASLDAERNYNLGAKVGASLFSALNEGRIEGRNLSTEALDNYNAEIDNDYNRQLQSLKLSMERMKDTGEYSMDYLNNYYLEQKQALLDEQNSRKEEAKLDALRAGNVDMFLNIPILFVSNMMGTLSHYRTGFSNAERNTNIWWNPFKKEYTGGNVVGHGLKEALTEGNEEMMQAVASKFAENWYSKKYDEYGRQVSMSAADSLTSAFKDTYLNADAYQEFFAGALTGVTGVFMPHKVMDENGQEKWKFVQGGIFDSDTRKEIENSNKLAKILNDNAKLVKANQGMLHMVEMQSVQQLMDIASKEGSKFDFKNAEAEGLVKDIMHWKAAGKLDDYKALIGNPDQEVSDEELDNIIKLTTAKDDNGKAIASTLGLVDKDGNILAVDKNERDALKKKIQENRKKSFSLIDEINKSMEYIDKETGHRLNNEQLQTLTWMKVFPKNLDDRIEEMRSEIGDIIKNDKYDKIITELTNKMNSKGVTENQKDEIRNRLEFWNLLANGNIKALSKEGNKMLADQLGFAVDEGYISNEDANKIVSLADDISASYVYKNAFVKKLNEYLKPDGQKELADEIASYNKKIDRKDSINIAKSIKDGLIEDINNYNTADDEGKSKLIGGIRKKIANYTSRLLGLGFDKRNAVAEILLKDKEIGSFLEDQMKLDETFTALEGVINNSNASDSEKARQNLALNTLRNLADSSEKLFDDNFMDSVSNLVSSLNLDDKSKLSEDINALANPYSEDGLDFKAQNASYIRGLVTSDPKNLDVTVDENGNPSVVINKRGIDTADRFVSKQLLINELRNIRDILSKIKKKDKSNKKFSIDKIDFAKYSQIVNSVRKNINKQNEKEKDNTSSSNIHTATINFQESLNKVSREKGNGIMMNIYSILTPLASVNPKDDILKNLDKETLIALRTFDAFFNINSILNHRKEVERFLKNKRLSKELKTLIINSCKDKSLKQYLKHLFNDKNKVSEAQFLNPAFKEFVRSIYNLKDKVDSYTGVNITKANGEKLMQEDNDEGNSILLNFIGKIYSEQVKRGEKADTSENAILTTVDVINKLMKDGIYNYFNTPSSDIRQSIGSGIPINNSSLVSLNTDMSVIQTPQEKVVDKDAVSQGNEPDNKVVDDKTQKEAIDNNSLEDASKINTSAGEQVVIMPDLSEYDSDLMKQGKFVKLSDIADIKDENINYDPTELQDFMKGVRYRYNSETQSIEKYNTINSYEFINSGKLKDYVDNGGKIYLMSNSFINGEGSMSELHRNWTCIASQEPCYYMYENEKYENGVFTHGKLMKDANGKNIPRKDYGGTISFNGEQRSMKDILDDKPNLFYAKKQLNEFFIGIKLDNGEMLPIGKLKCSNPSKRSAKDAMASGEIQDIANVIFNNDLLGGLKKFIIYANGNTIPKTTSTQLKRYSEEQYRYYMQNKIPGVTVKKIKKTVIERGSAVERDAIVVTENGISRTFINTSKYNDDELNRIPYRFLHYNKATIEKNDKENWKLERQDEIKAYVTNVFDVMLKSDENGNTLLSNDNIGNQYIDISDYYSFNGVINGRFNFDSSEYISLGSEALTDSDGKTFADKIEDGSARIGIVVKRKEDGVLEVHDNLGNARELTSEENNLFAGATIMMLKRADGSMMSFMLQSPTYDRNLSDEISDKSISKAAEKLSELLTLKSDDSSSRDSIVFDAFNILNESVYIPINKVVNNDIDSINSGKSYEYHVSYFPDSKSLEITKKSNGGIEQKRIPLEGTVEEVSDRIKTILESFGCNIRINQSDLTSNKSVKSLIKRGILRTNIQSLSQVNSSFSLTKINGANINNLWGEGVKNLNDAFNSYYISTSNVKPIITTVNNQSFGVFSENGTIILLYDNRELTDDECEKIISKTFHRSANVSDGSLPTAKQILTAISRYKNGLKEYTKAGDFIKLGGGISKCEVWYDTTNGNIYAVKSYDEIESMTNKPITTTVVNEKQPPVPKATQDNNSQSGETRPDTKRADSPDESKKGKRRTSRKRVVDNSIEYKRMNIQKELEWLGKAMPWMSLGDRVKILNHLENVMDKGPDAWGEYKDGCIYLSSNAQEGTLYHEAYHTVFDLCLTDEEKNELYSEMRSNKDYSNLSNDELEEVMAEKFREFVELKEDASLSLGAKILNWFRELFTKIFNFRTYPHKMNCLFNRINDGYYSKSYNSVSSIYESSPNLKKIGTRQQYSDYIKTKTNGKLNSISYTNNFKTEDGSMLFINIGKNSNINSMFDNRYRQIAQNIGFDTSLEENGISYNQLTKPCLIDVKDGVKTINKEGFDDIKYVITKTEPYYLGTTEDEQGFEKYVNSLKTSQSKERRKWSDGISREEQKYLSERGISISEFNDMPNIIKDKIMECIG